MLRRIPATSSASNGDPNSLSLRTGFGVIPAKPFKVPTAAIVARASVLPPRKRKRVSYKEDGQDDKENDGDASDDEKKKTSRFTMGNKEYGPDGVLGDMGRFCNRKFPTFVVKPKEQIFSKQ